MPLLDPEVTATIGTLQSLEDAIAFRLGRLNLPCPDCTADQRCIDHACDLDLIAGYQDRYAAGCRDALADMDPGDIEQIMQPAMVDGFWGVIVSLAGGDGPGWTARHGRRWSAQDQKVKPVGSGLRAS
jgi:hypothetical protein